MKSTALSFFSKIAVITAIVAIALMAQFSLATPQAHASDTATNQKISDSEIIARAQNWVYKGYTYSQSVYKPDALGTDYRTDCSGLVSMAWHLDKSYVTSDFNVDKSGMWHTISIDSMVQGDAYVRHDSTEDHMELFDKWDDPSDHSKGFEVYSFNKDGYTVENPIMLNNVGKSGHRSYSSLSGFHAIRYDNMFNDAAGTTNSSLVSGSSCSASQTYSLPNSTVDITERTCYASTRVNDPAGAYYIFHAQEEVKWTGGGSGKLDGFTAHVDVQKNDENASEGYCSGLEDDINAASSGTEYCEVSFVDPSSGSWTADGWLHYDVNNDGNIWNLVYVTGSPSTTF